MIFVSCEKNKIYDENVVNVLESNGVFFPMRFIDKNYIIEGYYQGEKYIKDFHKVGTDYYLVFLNDSGKNEIESYENGIKVNNFQGRNVFYKDKESYISINADANELVNHTNMNKIYISNNIGTLNQNGSMMLILFFKDSTVIYDNKLNKKRKINKRSIIIDNKLEVFYRRNDTLYINKSKIPINDKNVIRSITNFKGHYYALHSNELNIYLSNDLGEVIDKEENDFKENVMFFENNTAYIKKMYENNIIGQFIYKDKAINIYFENSKYFLGKLKQISSLRYPEFLGNNKEKFFHIRKINSHQILDINLNLIYEFQGELMDNYIYSNKLYLKIKDFGKIRIKEISLSRVF